MRHPFFPQTEDKALLASYSGQRYRSVLRKRIQKERLGANNGREMITGRQHITLTREEREKKKKKKKKKKKTPLAAKLPMAASTARVHAEN